MGEEALGAEFILPQFSVGLRTVWLGPGYSQQQAHGTSADMVSEGCRSLVTRECREQALLCLASFSCSLCFPSLLVRAE